MVEIQIIADSKYKVDKSVVRERMIAALARHHLTDKVQVVIEIVGRRRITELNETYLKHQGVTDVLSFPLNDPNDNRAFVARPDGILDLGEIVVCYPVAMEGAVERQVTIDEQIADLAEHGLMHLLGFHHE